MSQTTPVKQSQVLEREQMDQVIHRPRVPRRLSAPVVMLPRPNVPGQVPGAPRAIRIRRTPTAETPSRRRSTGATVSSTPTSRRLSGQISRVSERSPGGSRRSIRDIVDVRAPHRPSNKGQKRLDRTRNVVVRQLFV